VSLESCSIQFSELDGVHEFNACLAHIDDGRFAGLGVNALDVDGLTGSLGLFLGGLVGANASLEGLTGGGHAGVLDTDVNTLGDDAVSNALVHDDTEGVLGHVEDSAGLTVVELVGHTSLDRTVSDDIDVITLLVDDEVLAQGDNTMLSERLAEQISGASSKTETVGHFSFKPSKYLIITRPFEPEFISKQN